MEFTSHQYYNMFSNLSRMLVRRGYSLDYMQKNENQITYEDFLNIINGTKKNNTITIQNTNLVIYIQTEDQYIAASIFNQVDSGSSKIFSSILSTIHDSVIERMKKENIIQKYYKTKKYTLELKDKAEKLESFELIKNEKIKYICLLPTTPTPQLIKQVESIFGNRHGIELFDKKLFVFDILNHIYQPKIVKLLNNEEKTIVMKDYETHEKGFPKISKSEDPLVKYFNAKVGDMFMFVRTTLNFADQTYYRIVIN